MKDDPRDFFDEGWYREQCAAFEGDAWEHYREIGWRESYNPHPLFDVGFYLGQHPELVDGDVDPLTHYLARGHHTLDSPHPLFDGQFYQWRYHDRLEGRSPLVHYCRYGWKLDYDPHPFFSSRLYRERYEDIRLAELDPLEHFVRYGALEKYRSGNDEFDRNAYQERHHLRGVNPVAHFATRLFWTRKLTIGRIDRPKVSVVILNYGKARMTLECVTEVLASTYRDLEIVVVDNGSSPDQFEVLTRYLPSGVKVVRLATNRFFGEGNNIGIEVSRGEFVLFLNNDAFVATTTIETLVGAFERHDDIGAAGPLFRYGDGRVQEAGGMMSSCGTALQRGKFLPDPPAYLQIEEPVDYISAACLLVRREDLDTLAGFDLIFDPAYYEDTDLSLRLSVLGKKTYFCPSATVVHIENATSRDSRLGLSKMVEINRDKFIARWGAYLSDRTLPTIAPPARLAAPRASAGSAVLFTPYPLTPGGGERFLLDIASILSEERETTVVTPERYSEYRLRTLAREMEIDLSRVRLATVGALQEFAQCDLFFAIGNEVLPTVRPIGKRNFYICQFPFPMSADHLASAYGNLPGYDTIVVYSTFVAEHYARRAQFLGLGHPEMAVLAPACPLYGEQRAQRQPHRILHVGRFAREGHDKKQDVLIEAFRMLYERNVAERMELHLVGSLPTTESAREHLARLRAASAGLPVRFHVNASAEIVRDLYTSSSYYWHATGCDSRVDINPELHEHFGISVVEAMSAGVIPLVYASAGPKGIVADRIDGFHWKTIDELAAIQERLFLMDADAQQQIRDVAIASADRYSKRVFKANLETLIRPKALLSESRA